MSRLLQATRLSRVNDGSTGEDKQDVAARKYAESNDDAIVAVAPDLDVSGSVSPFKRPRLGPWLTDPALRGQYDTVLASDLDRLGRNARDLHELRNWAEDHGKRLQIISPPLTWPPAEDDLSSGIIWDVLGRLAEYELRQIRKRSVATQVWLKENGYLVGRPPFGFRVVPVPGSGVKDDHKTLEPDPALTAYVVGMVERALRGDSLTSICEWLDSEGVEPPQGGIWSPKSVSQIIRNPALIGRRTDAQGRTVLRFDGIIDMATWKAVKAKLDNNPRRRGAVSSDPAMLTGVILCGICGKPSASPPTGVMHRRKSVNKRKDGSRTVNEYYRCDGTPREPSTCKNMVPLAMVDAWVDEWFTGNTPDADREISELITIPGHGHDDELAQNAADIADLDIDADDYDSRLVALRTERKRLQALPGEPDRTEEVPTGVKVRDHWLTLTAPERRDFLIKGGVLVLATRELVTVVIPQGMGRLFRLAA